MIKNIAARIVSHFFSRYIDKLNSSQLELEIWNGKVKLENVKILQDALASHQLPFTVKNGTIGSISLTIPWSRLRSEPCVVKVENIFIVATIAGNIIVSKDLEARRDVDMLHEEEEAVAEGGTLYSIYSQAVDNVKFHIKNLHVRVELPINNSIVSIGVTIASINAFSVNDALEYAFFPTGSSTLRKKVEVSDLSIYIDTEDNPIPLDRFDEIMKEYIYSQHHYFLRPFTFNGVINFHRDDSDYDSELFIDTKALDLAIDTLQWRGLMELERQYEMFNTRRLYSHCGRPVNYPRSQRSSGKWWRYGHRSAIAKKNKLSFDPTNALDILVNRKKYLELTKTATKPEIKAFEKQFELPVVLFLRCYANVAENNQEVNAKLSAAEIKKVIDEEKKVQKSKAFGARLTMESLSISILACDLSPITRLATKKIVAKYDKQGYDHQLDLSIDKLSMFNDLSFDFNRTLAVDSGISAKFIINANKPNDIEATASDVVFVVDLKYLSEIANFFKKERKFIYYDDTSPETVKTQIQTVIDYYKGVNLDISINNTKVVLPYQKVEKKNHLLELECKFISILSAPNNNLNADDFLTLYDKYVIDFNDASINMDDCVLTKSFNTNINFDVAIVESDKFEGIKTLCNFTTITANLSTYQYLLLTNIILYLVDSIEKLLPSNPTSPDSSLSLNETDEVKNVSVDLYSFICQKIELTVFVQKEKMFLIDANDFRIDLLLETKIHFNMLIKSINAYEFLTSPMMEEFGTLGPLKIELKDDFLVEIDNANLIARQKCLLYILEFFGEPETFESRMGFDVTFQYSEIKYESQGAKSEENIFVDVKLNNPKFYLNNNVSNIGLLISKSVEICVNIDDSFSIELYVQDSKLVDENHPEIKLVELQNLMFVKFTPIFLQVQLQNPLILDLLFEKVATLICYVTNLTLPLESLPGIPMMEYDISVKSINGNLNGVSLDLNDFFFRSKNPKDFNLSLNLLYAQFNNTSIIDIKKLFVSMKNEIVINDKSNEVTEENKAEADEFLKNERDIKILQNTKFSICSSKTSIKAEAISFGFDPDLIKLLPYLRNNTGCKKCKYNQKIKKINYNNNNLNDNNNNINNNNNNSYNNNDNNMSKFYYEENNKYFRNNKKVTKIENEEDKISNNFSFDLSINVSLVSFTFLENSNSLLALRINEIFFENNEYSIGSCSLFSEGNEKIASFDNNFITYSDDFKSFYLGNLSFHLSYGFLLKLCGYSLKFSPLIPYFYLFFYSPKNISPKPAKKNKIPSFSIDCKQIALYIADKENNNEIVTKIGFRVVPEQFEINYLSANLIVGDSVSPLLDPLSIKCLFQGERINLSISPVFLTFSLADVNIISKLISKVLEVNKHYSSNFNAGNKIKSNDSYSLPLNFTVSPIESHFTLCFNDRTPFVKLNLVTSEFVSSERSSIKVDSSLVYFNSDTGNSDQIVEPFHIILKSHVSSSKISYAIHSAPIVLNMYVPFMKQLITLYANKDQQTSIQSYHYKFVNLMGVPISLKVGGQIFKDIQSGESILPQILIKENMLISVQFGIVHFEKFTIGQLFYPIALSIHCIVYRENNIITISSPFCFHNMLNIPVSVYSDTKLIGRLKPNEKLPIPSLIDIKKGFFISSGQIRPSSFRVSKSESFNFNEAVMGTISLNEFLAPPYSNSSENMLKVAAYSRQAKIVPYMLREWSHSSPVSYSIFDENGGSFISRINQRIFNGAIGMIEIIPIVSIVNELPFEIGFQFADTDAILYIKSGESSPIILSSEGINETMLKCRLGNDTYGASDIIEIKLIDNSKTKFILQNMKKSLNLIAHANTSNVTTKIFIYSPAILYNHCGFPLKVRQTRNSRPMKLEDNLLWGSETFAAKSKLKLQIQCENYKSSWQEEKIDCTTVGISSTIFLPTNDKKIFVPIHHSIENTNDPFSHTVIVTFRPALFLVNETDFTFHLCPPTNMNYSLTVEPHKKLPIMYSLKNSQFYIQFDDFGQGVNIVLASPTRQVFRIGTTFIEMETVLAGGSLSCHLRNAKMPTPIVFTNLIDVTYSVFQKDNTRPIIVNPQSTSPFAYDDPFGDNEVVLCISGSHAIVMKVPLSSNCDPTKIEGTEYFIEIKIAGNGHRMFIISELQSDDYSYQGYGPELNFSVSIRDITVSLINKDMSELCLVYLYKLNMKTSTCKGNYLYEVILDEIQIDDQSNSAAFPVFLYGRSSENAKFLHLSAVCYHDAPLFTSFKNFTFSMQKISVFADIAFIGDMISFIESIIPLSVGTLRFSDENKSSHCLKNEDSQNHIERKYNGRNYYENDDNYYEEESSVGHLYCFGNFLIHPFLASVTFRGHSGRPMSNQISSDVSGGSEVPVFMKLIPNITNATVALESFQVSNFLAPMALLKQNFLANYKNQITAKLWRIAGHSDILFNVFGIAETFGLGFKSLLYDPITTNVESPEKILMATKGGGRLIFGTVGSILQGGEGFIRNISSLLNFLGGGNEEEDSASISTDSANLSAADTVQDGITSFGNGLVDGISGLLTKPIEGGKKDGIVGAVTGIAKGLFGVVTKPVAGVLNLSAGVIGGVRKAINSEETCPRHREPNAYPMAQVGGYNKTVSACLAYGRKYHKKRKYHLMSLKAVVVWQNTTYALFDKRIFLFNKNTQDIQSKAKISKIENVSQAGRKVMFEIRGNTKKAISFECETEEYAEKFVVLLCSLITFGLIF